MQGFQKLQVWRKAMTLARNCYLATDTFPTHERFGLALQIVGATLSEKLRRLVACFPASSIEHRWAES